MRDLASCFSEHAVQVSGAYCSGANAAATRSCISASSPSAQNAVVCLYRLSLSSRKQILVSLAWCRNSISQGLTLTFNDDHSAALKLTTHSRLFRKLKGAKSIDLHGFAIEVHWDLTAARYEDGPEPVDGYYVLITVDSELGPTLGDLAREAASRKLRPEARHADWSLVSRQEHFSGGSVYTTRARFSESGPGHDISIQCGGEGEGLKQPVFSVWIDRKPVMRVKRLQWNFRGNQTIFVDGILVDLMWDVHGWFFGPGRAVFMFRTRSGMDSRLWLEEKTVKGEHDNMRHFSLFICASKDV